jgi:tetratricopeptide (TPR) repeat protein
MRQLFILLSLCLLIVSCGHTSPQDKVLLFRADSLMEAHPDSALTLLQHITDSKHLSFPDHALYALLMSQALDKNNIEVQSDSLIRIATAYYYEHKDFSRAGYAYFYLSRVEENRGDAEGRAAALLKAQSYAVRSNNYKLQGFVYGEKAREYQAQQQPDSMLLYYRLAYLAFQKAGDRRNTTVGLINIANCYYMQSRFDSALVYFHLADETARSFHETSLHTSICRFTGLIAYCQKNYPLALHDLRVAAQTRDQYDYSKWIDMAMIYLQTNQLDSAKIYLKRCSEPHEMAPACYRLWQQISQKEGHLAAALYYADRVSIAKDSLSERALQQSFAGLEKKYDFERVHAENSQLVIANQHNRYLLLLAVVAILVLGFILLLFGYLARLKEVKRRDETIAKEQETNRLMQQQFDLQKVVIEILEEYKTTASNDMASGKLSDTKRSVKPVPASFTPERRERIITCIKALYPSLYEFLASYPSGLNSTEILLCCFIRSGFDSALIAPLLNITRRTFYVFRFRVREKLELRPKDNLTDFLAKK